VNESRHAHEHSAKQRLHVCCYKCSAGCMHLEYGNAMFTFTQEQFLALAEIISTAQRRLLLERAAQETVEFTADNQAKLVM
jgi:hypothetical protein